MVDQGYNQFMNIVTQLLEKYAPEKVVKIPKRRIIKNPWMTSGLLKSARTRDTLYAKSLNKPKDNITVLKFTKYRNTFNKIKKVAKESYFANLLNEYKNDLRKTWTVINKLIGRNNDKSSISDNFIINEHCVTNPQEISNGFCNYFTDKFSEQDTY